MDCCQTPRCMFEFPVPAQSLFIGVTCAWKPRISKLCSFTCDILVSLGSEFELFLFHFVLLWAAQLLYRIMQGGCHSYFPPERRRVCLPQALGSPAGHGSLSLGDLGWFCSVRDRSSCWAATLTQLLPATACGCPSLPCWEVIKRPAYLGNGGEGLYSPPGSPPGGSLHPGAHPPLPQASGPRRGAAFPLVPQRPWRQRRRHCSPDPFESPSPSPCRFWSHHFLLVCLLFDTFKNILKNSLARRLHYFHEWEFVQIFMQLKI